MEENTTRLGIKDVVNFVYSSGDLVSELFENYDDTDGKKAHQYLQSKYNEDSQKEYYVKRIFKIGSREVFLNGFIDGVLKEKNKVTIEEIKSTSLSLEEIKESDRPNYLAQLKLYAYIYMLDNELKEIDAVLTYISIDEYRTRKFRYHFYIDDLEEFTLDTLSKYVSWLEKLSEASARKLESIGRLEFPYPNYRRGQKDLIEANLETMQTKNILYVIAPTGIGKTMATLYSALKSISSDDEKLFYLTAKNTGKEIAIESVGLLKEKGLRIKTLVLTAKHKSCLNLCKNCDPVTCPFALGYFDRLNDALLEIFEEHDLFTYDVMKQTCLKHQICLFEFSLYLSYFCDLIICDYNYVFDPTAHLIRYFDDDTYKPKILVDEAHNLITRSRSMFSSEISTANFKILIEIFKGFEDSDLNEKIVKDLEKMLSIVETYDEYITKNTTFFNKEYDLKLISYTERVVHRIETFLDENKKNIYRDEILEQYFPLLRFSQTVEYFDENYVFMIQKEFQDFKICLYCLDASSFLMDTIKRRVFGITFFSATMYPIDYHKELLTRGAGQELILRSPFEQDNLDLIVVNSVDTRYTNRRNTVPSIVEIIDRLVSGKVGNYIVFFPSYQYMQMVKEEMIDKDYDIIVQKPNMLESERDEYLNLFKNSSRTQVGLFVMGGIFSEGIDYVGDLLSGVVIVSVCLPQINDYNNILKSTFDSKYDNGFEYAYTYPGFNRVVQAAGRVIRTQNDRGIVVLVDKRYTYMEYRKLYPKHWSHFKVINDRKQFSQEVNYFWNK